MSQDNFKSINHFYLIFVAFVLIQPVVALVIDFPSSLFVFKEVADLLNTNFIQSGGRYVIAAINISVITLLYIKKYRTLALKFSLALLSCAIIAHLLVGIQLPFYGEAQKFMESGHYESAIVEAINYGFSGKDVILTFIPNGYKVFAPERYDFGFSFVSYLIALGFNLVLLKWNHNNFSLIFVAFVLIQPVIALVMDLPSSLFIFKKVAELLNTDFIQSDGRYVIAAINIVVITLLYIKKYRAIALNLSLALLSCAIIAHLLVGIQLPFYGEAQTSMYGMIQNGDYFSAIDDASNYGFSSEYIILTPNGYKMFVPERYDFGFSFVSYLIALGLNLALLKWSRNNKPLKTNPIPNED
ncbi:hypothetical protein [Vibrio cholerae]|uniref:hypothetical protein n=1 Tax=Vibrio cholerae TaxID=666 RepID=UPI00301B005F